MRIVLIGFGSRGDVQPLLALATGLETAGYEVAIAAGANFRDWIQQTGFTYEHLRTDMYALVNSDSGKEWIENSANPIREARNMRRMVSETGKDVSEDFLRIGQQYDVLVSGLPTFGVVEALATKFNKQHITILFAPLIPTRNHTATMVPMVPYNIRLNRLSGYIGQYFTYWIFKDIVSQVRQELGLEQWSFTEFRNTYNHRRPVIYGLSNHVMPRPDDWASHIFVTGYWFYDNNDNWQAPQSLVDFLSTGTPPVYIGFGSMSTKNPDATTQIMINALQQSNQRGIIHSGWAGLSNQALPSNVYLLDYAPHEWLFPQMGAIIHHGGAGTTAAALRSGIPTCVIPHMADQPYWGRRVHELGVAPSPIHRTKLSHGNLAGAIQQMVNNMDMQKRAKELSKKINSEDGIINAVHTFKQLLG